MVDFFVIVWKSIQLFSRISFINRMVLVCSLDGTLITLTTRRHSNFLAASSSTSVQTVRSLEYQLQVNSCIWCWNYVAANSFFLSDVWILVDVWKYNTSFLIALTTHLSFRTVHEEEFSAFPAKTGHDGGGWLDNSNYICKPTMKNHGRHQVH